MPEGQYTGSRKTYIYNSDNNETTYLIRTDETLGDIPGCGLTAATAATAEASDGRLPTGFRPRVVHWQGMLGDRMVRKELICGSTAATLYNTVTPTQLNIDGSTEGTTTGRRGEKVTFLSLPAAGDDDGGGAGDGGDGGV